VSASALLVGVARTGDPSFKFTESRRTLRTAGGRGAVARGARCHVARAAAPSPVVPVLYMSCTSYIPKKKVAFAFCNFYNSTPASPRQHGNRHARIRWRRCGNRHKRTAKARVVGKASNRFVFA
jgi:hypothetical protein